MSKWQPIETAPKDGRNVLLFERTSSCDDPDGQCYMVCRWEDRFDNWVADNKAIPDPSADYTHWMPLPEPPA